jgi:uncharacterized protein YkwD
MRLLMFRTAGIAVMLAFAGAVARPAAFGHPLAAQSTGSAPTAQVRERPHQPPRTPTVASAVPTVASAASTAGTDSAAPRPAAVPLSRLAVGSGQLGLINQDRAAAGLPPLRWNACLAAIAVQNAARMAAQGYISHANGVTLDLGCRLGLKAGENVGYISSGINDAQMNAIFMASPEHRANILGPFHYVGAAWVVAPNGSAYVAVEFG